MLTLGSAKVSVSSVLLLLKQIAPAVSQDIANIWFLFIMLVGGLEVQAVSVSLKVMKLILFDINQLK